MFEMWLKQRCPVISQCLIGGLAPGGVDIWDPL